MRQMVSISPSSGAGCVAIMGLSTTTSASISWAPGAAANYYYVAAGNWGSVFADNIVTVPAGSTTWYAMLQIYNGCTGSYSIANSGGDSRLFTSLTVQPV
eukprot:TRINITY_DN9129_c0_g1_i1.p3 TRINITY_DN9129_c0_g1~~TRINITY_DN9129_c0_g1_i1.p3  ORF type:complete len:100 (-),score=22.89 TRINITY_DN9129_c0_g1_i1:152-451(-)